MAQPPGGERSARKVWHRFFPVPLSALSSPKEAVRQFTPSWFTMVMSTGIVGTLIGSFPYDAPAKLEVGWAFWWFTLVLFCVFSLTLIARFVFFTRDALLLFSHPYQSLFLGAIPPSLAVIVNGMPIFLAHWWDPTAVLDAAVALWWLQCALALACTLLLPFYMLARHQYPADGMTALLLLPLLPCVVAAGSGGFVARHADVDAARGIAYMSFLLFGIGVLLCYMVSTMYYRRLLRHSLPPKELIVSSFLPVGPMGMAALALLNLGAACERIFPPPTPQEWAQLSGGADISQPATLSLLFQASAGSVANAGGALVALVLWGNAVWWLVVAVASVGVVLSRSTLPFNIGWWGFVFPLGVFANAANELWQRLPGMGAMRVAAAALIACVIALWAVVFSYTVVRGWNGSLFHAPCLADRPSNLEARKVLGPGLESRKDLKGLAQCGNTPPSDRPEEGEEEGGSLARSASSSRGQLAGVGREAGVRFDARLASGGGDGLPR